MATVVTFMSIIAVRVTIRRLFDVPICFIVMNLSHVITEFSFGKHFPEITQPLDNSFEVTHDGKSFIHSVGATCDSLQILLHISTTFVSSQPHTSHRALNLCIRISTV